MRSSNDIRLELDHVREHEEENESTSSNRDLERDKDVSKVDSECDDTLRDPNDSMISTHRKFIASFYIK